MKDGRAGTFSKALAWFHVLEQTLRIDLNEMFIGLKFFSADLHGGL